MINCTHKCKVYTANYFSLKTANIYNCNKVMGNMI